MVQTRGPSPPVITHALRMDYEQFAAAELALRRRLYYPPPTRLVRFVLADCRPHQAREEAECLAAVLDERARRVHPGLRVDAPEPCALRRQAERLRYQVVLRAPHVAAVGALLDEVGRDKHLAPRVQRFSIDVDPVDWL
jgi:primosomal protein N' (replication factor Y)